MIIRAYWLQRLGFVPKQRERSLWIIGSTQPAFESISPLLEEIARTQPRLRVILSADTAVLRDWLTDRFSNCLVSDLPYGNYLSSAEFLARGNIRVAVALENVKSLNHAMIGALRRRAVALVALSARIDAPEPEGRISNACEILLEVCDADGPRKQGNHLSRTIRGLSFGQVAAKFGELLGRDLKARRDGAAFAARFWQFVLDNCDHWPFRWRLRRYHEVDELGAALGDPQTILCLGNGPSSEDEALKGLAHDILFRVNHSWLKRGFLTRPDVVFTGGRPTMRAISRVVFGLQNTNPEHRLAAARFFNPLVGATRFFNANDMNSFWKNHNWGSVRPTNGASMLAAAVGLQPKCLIVAGIDMFQHPRGSYPGDDVTPNAFSPAHDREAELAFLLKLFDSYSGELVIIGDVLEQEWLKHKNKRVAR
jgi:3-Deoxy-D-manno-octulosonic-acid transferase (kdotransferase)